ncbi:MAG: HU family DNA-binding protein [Paludibacter sp.]
MNKEKISSQEIIDLVASKASVSKRAAEEFLKVMIATIEEALLAGDVVKIKNFGTFKLQWNEPRKSVNVQTGEEIILPGYHKVAFTPDTTLKDVVNEPFAHLEPVQLDGDDEFVIPEKKEEEVLDPLRIFTEQASEIKDLLSEINALSAPPKRKERENKEIVIKDYFDLEEYDVAKAEEKTSVEPIIAEEPIAVEEPVVQKQIIAEEPVVEEQIIVEEPVVEPESEVQPEVIETAEPVFMTSKMDEVNVYIPEPEQENYLTENSDSVFDSTPFLVGVKPKRRKKKWLWISVVLVLLAVSVGLYLLVPQVNKAGNVMFTGAANENVLCEKCINSRFCEFDQEIF